jgi:hypothetical protein
MWSGSMDKDKYIKELEMETFDLIAKITSILYDHDLWNDDDTFTFKDGDRWAKFEPLVEEQYLDYEKQENECYD